MILALRHAVPGDDAVPVVDQAIDGEVAPEGVDIGEIAFERGQPSCVVVLVAEQSIGEIEKAGGRQIVGIARDGFRQPVGQPRVGRSGVTGRGSRRGDADSPLQLGQVERRARTGRPNLFVEHALAAVAEAVRHEAVVDVLGQREQAERLAVKFEPRVDRARRDDAELAEQLIGKHLAHLRGVVLHRVKVEPLHSIEALPRLVLIELDLVGELGAKLAAALVEAGEEQAEEALVADADLRPDLAAQPQRGAHILLGARIGAQPLELGGRHFDRVCAHLFEVEDVAARVAARLIDPEARRVGREVGRRRQRVVAGGDADRRGQQRRSGQQREQRASRDGLAGSVAWGHEQRLRDCNVNIS